VERFLWICAAGAAGAGTRHLVSLWAAQRFGAAFPVGTLVVNLAGCFALAALMHLALTLAWPATLRTALAVGFLGGLTTYSSFNYESMRLVDEGSIVAAGLNVLLTVGGGLAAGWLGLAAARGLLGR
jgi:CrcB protein